MERSHIRRAAATAAAAILLCLVGQASGQYNTTIGFFDVTPVTVYGQAPTYRIALPTSTSGPTAPTAGNAVFQNATNTPLISFALSAAAYNAECVSNSCSNVYTFTGFSASGPLPAGVYNKVAAAYTGGTSNGVTFNPVSSSTQGLADASFQVLPASTEFFYSLTPFTLSNFTKAFSINVTNINGTNVVPAGAAYDVITRTSPNPTKIGNFSLTLTPVGKNSVNLKLPSSFDAAALLTTGSYTAVYYYYPTSDFTTPVPLSIQFNVAATGTPSPPPPPAGPPSPPSPPSPQTGSVSTTITLSIFFNQQSRRLLGGCSHGVLVFQVAVKGPSPGQVPADGTVTVTVGGVAIGSQAVVPDANLGSASITITRPIDGSVYGYGAQTATAIYSGSSNGVYLPSEASATFVIPECTNKWTEITKHVEGVIETVKDIIVPEPYFTPGNGQYYGYGNGYSGYGYPQGSYLPGQGAVGK
ncbi:hypothetical protein WJX75_008711 [Coccomyxa subellipsoidea]|uniref:Extracellular protein n=1 Tax=Coccomyxa subellipsoidea TaxID=248742 RepID=A0ABR2YCH5_9CHLO